MNTLREFKINQKLIYTMGFGSRTTIQSKLRADTEADTVTIVIATDKVRT